MLSFFKRKVGRKIGLGYILIYLILLGIGFFTLSRLTLITAQMDKIAHELSVEMALVRDIAAKARLASLYANLYISTQRQNALNNFNKNYEQLRDLITDSEKQVMASERRSHLRAIQQAVNKYGTAFQEISELLRDRQGVLLGSLKINAFLTDNILSSIRVDVNAQSDPRVFLSFGNAQNAFLEMRLNTSEFIRTGDERYSVLHRRAVKNAQDSFKVLEEAFIKPTNKRSAYEAGIAVQKYAQGFQSIQEKTRRIRDIVDKQLMVLEPEIGQKANQIAAGIDAQRISLYNLSHKLVIETKIQLAASIAAAFTISLLLGLFITRKITRPLAQVMAQSQEVADHDLRQLTERLNSLSHGDMRPDFEVRAQPLNLSQLDEVGRMANAFDNIILRMHEAETAFQAMSEYLRRMAATAQSVARGDLNVTVRIHSDQDRLGAALAAMLDHLNRADKEVKNYQEHLKDLVAERTAQLELSRQSLAALMSNLPGMAYRAGLRERRYMEFVSSGAEELTGYTPKQLTNKEPPSYADLIHPQDLENVQKTLRTALRENSSFTMLYRITAADRSLKWVLEKGQVVTQVDGNPASIEGFITDITERKRAEEALKESELRLRQIIDLAPLFIFAKNREGKFLLVNKAMADAFGADVNEVTGKLDSEFYAQYDEIEKIRRDDIQVLDTGRPLFIPEEKISNSKGEVRFLQTAKIPFVVSGTNDPAVLGVAMDVTERKMAEQEKARLEEQLKQSQKMEAVGILAGGIAHDFNNLLQAIGGYAQLLLINKNEADPDYNRIAAIQKTSERAALLIRQLLLFSRKAETQRRRIQLNEVVQQAKTILDRTIPRMIEIELKLGADLWAVNADPIQIEQILLNLGSNAADAMPEGGKCIIETQNILINERSSGATTKMEPGRYVLLTVSDTGCGMDQDSIQHVFEPFFTTKEIGKGTGLGLASVYGIVAGHGGLISCESETGSGTTFLIYIPASEIEVKTDPSSVKEPQASGGTENILIVDDEDDIREIVSEALKHFGYNVLTAASGEEALQLYSKNPRGIDLTITDISMPGIGGYRCLEKILKINPDAKVIIASGYSSPDHSGEPHKTGAAGYISKPYQLAHMVKKIRLVLDQED